MKKSIYFGIKTKRHSHPDGDRFSISMVGLSRGKVAALVNSLALNPTSPVSADILFSLKEALKNGNGKSILD